MSLCIRIVFLCMIALGLSACVAPMKNNDYTALRTAKPRSILVVPVINRSVEVDAPDYFLSTISRPMAERGYYVFPVHLVKRVMEDDGLSDANMVHAGDPAQLGKMFGTDSIMYVTIERWDAQYMILSTAVTVELSYRMKSAATGETLWENTQKLVYQPQNNSSGGLAGLIASAIVAAITRAAPNYVPLAQQANMQAVSFKGRGLPAGPYDELYQKDQADF
ncbi:MAG: GNA1162 family protein [Pseudomonadota bacterium]